MLVSRVRAFEQEPQRPRVQHDVDDRAQRDVAMVGALVVAPAHVHAHALRRDVACGVVQRLDVLRDRATEVFDGLSVRLRERPAGGQVGAVDLEHEAGVVDRVVLLFHRVGQRGDVVLVGRVVLVGHEEGDHTRRRRGHEHIRHVDAGGGVAEVRNVALHLRVVAVGDRSGARGVGHRR